MASTNNYLHASELNITTTNPTSTIVSKLNNLETKGKVLQIVYNLGNTNTPTTLTSTSFSVPSYIKYTNEIEYSTFTHPISLTNSFALKIYAYLSINTTGIYVFKINTTDKIKLFLNNYLVLDNINLTTISTDVYLNAGTYMIYIEKIAAPTDVALYLKCTPKSSSTLVSINNYLNTSFSLLANAKSSRDTAITTYCTPATNLYSTDSTNICNTSLSTTPLLNDLLLNTYCFPASTGISKNSLNKLNDDCKAVYNRPTLNANIKNNFNIKHKEWANKVVNDNTFTSNKDALEEYLAMQNPNEIDFPFTNTTRQYCQNDSEVRKNYNVLTQTENNFCKNVYNRTYTGTNKINVDSSIQQIKNNYCDPTQITTNLNTSDCINEYKNNNYLKNAISSYCFPATTNGRVLLKNDTDKKYHDNCKTIHQLPGLNSIIKSDLDTQYQTWATGVTTNTATDFTTHDAALNEYIISKNPTQTQFFGDNNIVTDTLINYCENKINSNNDKFTATNDNLNLCNTLYNNTTLNTNDKIKTSINKMKTNYCTAVGSDGKLRYETDTNCKTEYTGLLSNTISTRCNPNNTFTYSDKWCVDTSDANINSSSVPFSTMRSSRTNALKNATSTLEVKDYLNKKFLNDDNYKYATSTYNTISDPANKKLSDELLTNQLFQYCENKEPDYPTDPNSQCKGIYDTYKTNVAVIASRNKMRDELCKTDANITTDNEDTNTNNRFKCKTTIFNTTQNLDKFAPVVNAYCSKGNNIATSAECKQYYNDIESKILNSLNLRINSEPINTSSAFSNNFYQTNGEDYDKKIELSSFQNDYSNNGTFADDPTLMDDPVFYSNIETDYIKVKLEDDNSWLSLLLFFIFIILLVGLFSSCMYNKSNNKKNKVESKLNN